LLEDKEELKAKKAEIENVINTINQKGDFLENQQGLKKDWADLKLVEAKRKILEDRKKSVKSQKMEFHSKNLLALLISGSLQQKFGTSTSGSIVDIHEQHTARKYLEEEKCLCGIDMNVSMKEHLTKICNTSVNDIESVGKDLLRQINIKNGEDGLSNIYTTILENESSLDGDISTNEDALGKIKEKLQTTSHSLEKDVEEAEKAWEEAKIKKGILQSQYDMAEEENEKGFRDHSFSLSKNSALSTDIKVKRAQVIVIKCKTALKAFINIIEELVANERQEISETMSRHFLELTNNPRLYTGLSLDEDYRIQIELSTATKSRPAWEIGPSSGQSAMIAFAFITALNRKSVRDAPIVIDTPTGRLDPIHSRKIIRFWPNFAKQVIILYQPGELNTSQIESIEQYTSFHYTSKRRRTSPDESYIEDWDGNEEEEML